MPCPKTGLNRQTESPTGDHPAGKALEPIEMAPDARGHIVACDLAHLFCAVDRVEERWSPEGFDEGLEALDLSGKGVAVNPAERDDPPSVLDWHDQAPVALLRRSSEMREPHPVARTVGRSLEHGRGIGLIDADLGDFQSGRAELLQQRHRRGGAPGSVNDQIRRESYPIPLVVLAVNRDGLAPIG
jgi:hypothetical protein